MCGITGFLTSSAENEFEMKVVVARMADQLVQRGPDDSGVWVDRQAGPSTTGGLDSRSFTGRASAQPIESGRYVIVFNGEVAISYAGCARLLKTWAIDSAAIRTRR
jgi:asparagine synthase (glutamine-hydrolysing)